MNAVPSELLRQTERLSESVTRPIPGSRKIHVEGSRPDLRVPMREIALTRTPTLFGGGDNRRSRSTTAPARTPIQPPTSTWPAACPRCARAGSKSAATPRCCPA